MLGPSLGWELGFEEGCKLGTLDIDGLEEGSPDGRFDGSSLGLEDGFVEGCGEGSLVVLGKLDGALLG